MRQTTPSEMGCRPGPGMRRPRHILLVFVDGLGLPPGGVERSILAGHPALSGLLRDHCVPLDAGLGVDGVPQSATGQTALFTGVNAARRVGRHVEGFPTGPLRRILLEDNLFKRLLRMGGTCTFANAYVRRPGPSLPVLCRSATTVMTLAAFGDTRNREALCQGRAVYHDLTRESLARSGIGGVPRISEGEAAQHLVQILRTVDVCLFEYFLTDHAGHRRAGGEAEKTLASLDRFLGRLLELLDSGSELLLLTSDHGNIEEPGVRGHSRNQVPWAAWGRGAARALGLCSSILDVSPAIALLSGGGEST